MVKETAFQNSKLPMYAIYQLKNGEGLRYHRFTSFDSLKKEGNTVGRNNYDLKYTGLLGEEDSLEEIYRRFNIDRPADFTGHSLSVSDIIAINRNGKMTAYYVDSVGFKEVPEFFDKPELGAEPVVTVKWSEILDSGTLPLSEANVLLEKIDSDRCGYRENPVYKDTKFEQQKNSGSEM